MNQKKGFLLYFDACEELNALPPDQRGWILSALNEFARRCAEDLQTDAQAVLDCYPALLPEHHVACLVRFENIRRDTRRWNKQQASSGWTCGAREAEAWKYVR